MIDDFDCLIDKKIISSSTLSDDLKVITLITEKSTITLTAEGDCCSESWVEHYDVIPSGATIVKVNIKNVSILQEDGYDEEKQYHDLLQQYFYEIITDKGSFTIEMRNSSNGYYGGYLEINEKDHEIA